MCWWKKHDPVVPVTGEKVALLFGINDYQGSANDLQGCLNDIDDVEKKLNSEFPGFQIKKFKDSQVTTQRFTSEIEAVLKSNAKVLYIHYSGHGTTIGNCEALYLYNGSLLDDVICDLEDKTPDTLKVVIKFDSCFSGGMDDRTINSRYKKSRFYHIPGSLVGTRVVKKIGRREIPKWTIFAGCGEEQTSSDAEFSGRANGAFTYYDNKSYSPGYTYQQEINILRTHLPNDDFDQIPELTGSFINNLIFTNF